MSQHLVVTCLLDIQNLAFQRQNRLEAAVASLFGSSAGGLTFHEIDFATIRTALRTIGELAGEPSAIERAFTAR